MLDNKKELSYHRKIKSCTCIFMHNNKKRDMNYFFC